MLNVMAPRRDLPLSSSQNKRWKRNVSPWRAHTPGTASGDTPTPTRRSCWPARRLALGTVALEGIGDLVVVAAADPRPMAGLTDVLKVLGQR
jgi:hypothetical protein